MKKPERLIILEGLIDFAKARGLKSFKYQGFEFELNPPLNTNQAQIDVLKKEIERMNTQLNRILMGQGLMPKAVNQ